MASFHVLHSTNIRLGWKSLPGTNTLAYYENSLIADVKSFIRLGPGVTPSKIDGNETKQSK